MLYACNIFRFTNCTQLIYLSQPQRVRERKNNKKKTLKQSNKWASLFIAVIQLGMYLFYLIYEKSLLQQLS